MRRQWNTGLGAPPLFLLHHRCLPLLLLVWAIKPALSIESPFLFANSERALNDADELDDILDGIAKTPEEQWHFYLTQRVHVKGVKFSTKTSWKRSPEQSADKPKEEKGWGSRLHDFLDNTSSVFSTRLAFQKCDLRTKESQRRRASAIQWGLGHRWLNTAGASPTPSSVVLTATPTPNPEPAPSPITYPPTCSTCQNNGIASSHMNSTHNLRVRVFARMNTKAKHVRSQKNVNGPKTAIDAECTQGGHVENCHDCADGYTVTIAGRKSPAMKAKLVRSTRARHSDLSQIMIVVAR